MKAVPDNDPLAMLRRIGNLEAWTLRFKTDIQILKAKVNQVDTVVIKLEARLVKLEANGPKAIAAAIRENTLAQKENTLAIIRVAAALEKKTGGMNIGEEKEIFRGLKRHVKELKTVGKK